MLNGLHSRVRRVGHGHRFADSYVERRQGRPNQIGGDRSTGGGVFDRDCQRRNRSYAQRSFPQAQYLGKYQIYK